MQPSPTLSLKTVYIGAPTPTGTPASPSTIASPSPTSTPTPTQSLYDQAVTVYQVFFEEQAKALMAGGAETLPPALSATLVGDASRLVTALLQFTLEQGHHYVGDPEFQLVWVRPSTDKPAEAVVGLEACEEITGGIMVDRDDVPLDQTDRNAYVYRAYFQHGDHGNLVIYDLSGERVDSCPA